MGSVRYQIEVAATLEIATPVGIGRLHVAPARNPKAVLALGHGARAGIDAPDLVTLAEQLPPSGVTVVRFEQPWLAAGRDAAGPARDLDSAWRAALAELPVLWPGVPVFAGGRSLGARVACRCFDGGQRGLVLTSFPILDRHHPADNSRIVELAKVASDAYLFQIADDPYGPAARIRAELAEHGAQLAQFVVAPGNRHHIDTKAAQGRVSRHVAKLVSSVRSFIDDRAYAHPSLGERVLVAYQ
ncbi:MAG: hypothetical protein LBR20_07075 [Propionibacteriaceae bacterium]|jgi:predicted alpha/beta-hydrolase family hydrolase|nr:hypothetical protein [Propionibacteriaceae bacterium]